jgi:hypothetical protein
VNNPSTDSPEPVPATNSKAAHTSLLESPLFPADLYYWLKGKKQIEISERDCGK